MGKITLIKNYRNKDTLRLVEVQDVVNAIRSGEYAVIVGELRTLYPLYNGLADDDGTLTGWQEQTRQLPRLCFALQQENRQHSRLTLGYTGLVQLEVHNLTGRDEAEAVRRGAAEMPQTLAAFVGMSGQSVVIVCRGELLGEGHVATDLATLSDQQVMLFHENLYERARMIYNGQLGVTVEKLRPLPQRICYMSHDPQAVFNPLATPIYAQAQKPAEGLTPGSRSYQPTDDRQYASLHTIYEYNLTKAFDETEDVTSDEERRHLMLSLLAQYCRKTGIPMAVAQRLALINSTLNSDEQLVKKTFENAYRQQHTTRYREQKGISRYQTIPPETLLTMKINIFLNENYELRKNVMRGVAEYRQRTGVGFSFTDLTEEARNSITMRALEQGIRCWDKDIRRYVNSNDITLFDPINEYLEHLPKWDGRERVELLAHRIPTEQGEWPQLFHLWMRSMVAMWLGKGQLTGNALVPLLIGRQGCGKSSFCRILMPAELTDYYNDRINFKNESDLNLGLTSFALINLDEFDKITQRQQIVLKYLLSTADLKYRPPYGKAYSSHRRYASFIGTTNEQTPLTDPTGSRRFICVSINGDIDFQTPVDHSQLYAQLVHEIARGQRYWLTKDEERQLMQRNLQYQQLSGLGEMLMSLVQKPRSDEEGQWVTLTELSDLLKANFKGYKEDPSSLQKIGSYLSRPEYKFQSRRVSSGMTYYVKRKL